MIRQVSAEGRRLVKRFEGIDDGDPTTVNLDPYMDPVRIWTIGWGHAIFVGNTPLRGIENKARARRLYPNGISLQQAEDLLTADLLDTSRDVMALVTVPLTPGQFDALVSFQFNLGKLGKSTLLTKLNTKDYNGAANEFKRWKFAGGKVLAGLVTRRAAEEALFRKGIA